MTGGKERRVCLGAFAGAHGVKGHAKIKTFTEAPEGVAAYGPVETEDGARRFTLKVEKVLSGGVVIASAPEIENREDAQSLKGVRLYVARSALPDLGDDDFYLDDLVGLDAFDETGAPMGSVAAVYNFGAGDVLELKDVPGVNGARMVPFTKAAVPEVNAAERRIIISRAALGVGSGPILSDETGEIVSDDIEVDLAAMREEDA